MTVYDHQSGTRAAIVPKILGPRQILQDAITARCTHTPNPIQSMVTLAQKAGVTIKAIAKANAGRHIPTRDHLRLCCALEVDPLAGMGPAHYGLAKGFPEPSDFDFDVFSLSLQLVQHAKKHSESCACREIGIKAGTLRRLRAGNAVPIGAVLRACAYVGGHPFGYCGHVNRSAGEQLKQRETSCRGNP